MRALIGLWLFGVALATAAEPRTYTVGVEDLQYYPAYSVRDGEYAGIGREVLDRFAAQQGIVFRYEPLPVARLTRYFIDELVDFKFPDNANWQQSLKAGKRIVYSQPVFPYVDGVMVLPARRGQGIGQLKTLGTVRGFTAWDYLGLVDSGQVSLREANSLQNLVTMLQLGRVDGVYFNIAVANHYLDEVKQSGALVFDDTLPHTQDTYALSTIKYPALIDAFNAFLAAEQAWLAELQRRYNYRIGPLSGGD